MFQNVCYGNLIKISTPRINERRPWKTPIQGPTLRNSNFCFPTASYSRLTVSYNKTFRREEAKSLDGILRLLQMNAFKVTFNLNLGSFFAERTFFQQTIQTP